MWFLRQDGEWCGKRWFSFLVQEFVPCGWCSRAGAVAGMVVLRVVLAGHRCWLKQPFSSYMTWRRRWS